MYTVHKLITKKTNFIAGLCLKNKKYIKYKVVFFISL